MHVTTSGESGGAPQGAGRNTTGGASPAQGLAGSDALSLPPDSPWWLPILSLWPSITPGSHAAVVVGFPEGGTMPWAAFEAWLSRTGLAEPVPGSRPSSLLVRAAWLPVLDRALDDLLESEDVRARLLRITHGPRHRIVTRVARWARGAGRWPVLQEIWLLVSEDAANVPGELLPVLADLPEEARRERPILTWAAAVAEADAAPVARRADAMFGRLLLDAASVHADWALREDTDTAVLAGTLRMIAERRLPSSGRPLETSWKTKSEIDGLIDERSRAGRPPGRFALSFFRAMSARLALFRADFRGAIEEARWAAILSDSASVSALAAAVEALARSLGGEVRYPLPAAADWPAPERFRFGGLSQMAAVLQALSYGREALQTLDRDGVERALATTKQDMSAVAGVWAVRVAMGAFHAALWGDPPQGLNRLFAELADQSLGGQEQDEPMGELLLGRARELLLSKMGAFGAAALCSDSLSEPFRAIPQARSRLWAGQLGAAVRIIERALPNPELLHPERLQLLVMRGAATQLEGSASGDIRTATVSAFEDLLRARNYLAIATLPRPAREAVLGLCAPLADDPAAGASFALLRDRLGPEPDDASGGPGLFRLTEREAVLLPLLATTASVPEIARRLHVSVHTVRKQVATLREKFQAPTRAELVRKAGIYGALR